MPRSAAGGDWSWLWLTVGLGASAALCYAAWKYYARSTCLRTYGRDMTALAGETDPLIGRDDEIDRLVCILCRRTKNCAALVGAAGVGKTAVAEGLAQRIAAGKVPEALAGARVVEVDLWAMLAGTRLCGMFEERMKNVIKQAEDADGKVILFFDEMHTILDAGSSRVSDSGNMLKPALARGRIRCVGATTYDEYRRYIEKDPALERRFQKVHMEEPSSQATVAILQGLKRRYQKHHGLKIQDDALVAAAHLASRYVTDRQFPDKAIDLIDEACSTKKLQSGCEQDEKKLTVGPDDIARVVSRWTGIPVTTLNQDEKHRLIHLPERLSE